MTYLMAMPGMVNIIARENGAVVDKKIEVHDEEALKFDWDNDAKDLKSTYYSNT
jgi:twinfilin